MCGMGRTGTLPGCEQDGISPDLIGIACRARMAALAKILDRLGADQSTGASNENPH
jgi:4-aminobutyrate aminotransferase-like enzyme